MDYPEAVQGFLDDQYYRGNSPMTVLFYRERLQRFARETGTVPLTGFDEPTVRCWLMGKRHYSRNTLENYDRALRVFSNWLYRQGLRDGLPYGAVAQA